MTWLHHPSNVHQSMLRSRVWTKVLKIRWSNSNSLYKRWSSGATHRQYDPLNILFCGSDQFSISSLRALHRLQIDQPDKISNIDVVCRPDKRVGRGLKQLREVPIKSTAKQIKLTLHQIDTFKGWSPPKSINLVVAVSFGLLVPARILTAARYGGLNVHPSLLPDLRGPAPIMHTLLKQRSHTGVTLQTMHPTKLDHGVIIDQTLAPGIAVPSESTPDELLELLTRLGAEMLCNAIESGSFLETSSQVRVAIPRSESADYAPKVTPEDRCIDWHSWTADEILLRDRVLGRLWDMHVYSQCLPGKSPKRLTYHGPWRIAAEAQTSASQGRATLTGAGLDGDITLGITTADQKVLIPSAVTIEGESKGKGLRTLISGLQDLQSN